MPHQCLKCGVIIESGSPELLKGCSNCGGKKFFYISKPVSDQRREQMSEELRAKTDKDVRAYVQKMAGRLEQEDIERMTQEGEVMDEGDGWFRFKPPSDRSRVDKLIDDAPTARDKPTERKPKGRHGRNKPKGRDKEPKQVDVEDMGAEIEKMVSEMTGEEPKVHEPEDEPDTEPEKRLKEGTELETIKEVKGTRTKPKGHKPKIKGPASIQMKEKGVYEIDLDKLLDDSPVIVDQDGTYLIHLPSLLKTSQYKEKKRKRR